MRSRLTRAVATSPRPASRSSAAPSTYRSAPHNERRGSSALASVRDESQVRVDLARRLREVERVEVQPRHTRSEQVAAQLGRDLDAAPTDLIAVVPTCLDATDDVIGDGIAG